MRVVTVTAEELTEVVRRSVENAIESKLPGVLRDINKKAWLNPGEIEKEFGLTRRAQMYLRSTLRLPYRKIGKKVLVHRNEVEKYLRSQTVTVEDDR